MPFDICSQTSYNNWWCDLIANVTAFLRNANVLSVNNKRQRYTVFNNENTNMIAVGNKWLIELEYERKCIWRVFFNNSLDRLNVFDSIIDVWCTKCIFFALICWDICFLKLKRNRNIPNKFFLVTMWYKELFLITT